MFTPPRLPSSETVCGAVKQVSWLQADSSKAALSRPTWLSRTQAVGWLLIFEVPASILFAVQIDSKVVKRERSVSPHKLDIGMKSHWVVTRWASSVKILHINIMEICIEGTINW